MITITNKNECCGCEACANKCPKNAITMVEDEYGFRYPKVNKDLCINCDLCRKACPIIKNENRENEKLVYACYNKNEDIRRQSSSGGVFTLIAEYILKNDGIVIGAMFNKNFGVYHNYIEKVEDLPKLRTSKYIQSVIGETYRQAEQFLKDGKKVLFTGTPCQVEGLRTFLGKEYENLYTQDIICHGVPSPKVWKKYLEFVNKKMGDKPVSVTFRNKDKGWRDYSLNIQYKNKKYNKTHLDDEYMRAFIKKLSLRDSCYKCAFKKENRLSDITLADFWGISNVMPEMNDNKGTSLVIVNTKKGKKLYNSIEKEIIQKQVDFYTAIKYNPSMTQSVSMNKNRDKFFENLEKEEFNKLVNKYVPKESLIVKLKRKAKKIIKNKLDYIKQIKNLKKL